MDGITLEDVRRVVDEALDAREAKSDWLDAAAAAAYLGITTPSLHNLISRGRIQRYGNPGERIRLRRADLDAYIEGRRSS